MVKDPRWLFLSQSEAVFWTNHTHGQISGHVGSAVEIGQNNCEMSFLDQMFSLVGSDQLTVFLKSRAYRYLYISIARPKTSRRGNGRF